MKGKQIAALLIDIHLESLTSFKRVLNAIKLVVVVKSVSSLVHLSSVANKKPQCSSSVMAITHVVCTFNG
jgi:hypothetical protein